MLFFLIPKIVKEGKSYFTICFGCTGGKHRSVVIAEEVYKYLNKLAKELKDFTVSITHRDL
jgi:UPF0042 nucleotide-binding protein